MARGQKGEHSVTITVTFNKTQAWLYAQFLKRVCFSDYRARAVTDQETYIMINAGELIRAALSEKGFAPR